MQHRQKYFFVVDRKRNQRIYSNYSQSEAGDNHKDSMHRSYEDVEVSSDEDSLSSDMRNADHPQWERQTLPREDSCKWNCRDENSTSRVSLDIFYETLKTVCVCFLISILSLTVIPQNIIIIIIQIENQIFKFLLKH